MESDHSEAETRLVLRAQSGDRDALDELLSRAGPDLQRYLGRLVGREDLADDVVQETLIVVCRKLKWLREPSVFRAWTYRIASRIAFRAIKRLRREVRVDDAILDSVPDEHAARDLRQMLERESAVHLLEGLPPAARAVLLLHYIDGLTIAETSDVLEIPLGTAKSRLAYGIMRLRDSFSP